MSNRQKIDALAGDTLKVIWINSGAVTGFIHSTLLDRNHAVISSVEGVSSGNGHYYAFHTMPDSKQWLVNRWRATINANTYTKSQYINVEELWAYPS